MRRFLREFLAVSAGLLLLTAAGCGKGDDPYNRVGYSGEVTLDGEPMDAGFLYLEPLEQQPTQSYAVIQDGMFKVEAKGGAVPGRYRVSIVREDSSELPESVDPQTPEGAAVADQLSRKPPAKPISPLYNVQSKLVAELKLDEDNQFEFHLESDPDPSSFDK